MRHRGGPSGLHLRQCGSERGSEGSSFGEHDIGSHVITQDEVDDGRKCIVGFEGSEGVGTGRGNPTRVPPRRRGDAGRGRGFAAHGPEWNATAGGLHRCEDDIGLDSRCAGAIGVEGSATEISGGPAARGAAAVPIWMRPPSWLYLPHLYPPWMPRVEAQSEQRIAGDGEEGYERAEGRPIRGRDRSPGAPLAAAARESAEANMGDDAEIRGPLRGLGSRETDNRSRAQLRLDARNAHLRRSLEAHAERVARKRSQAECREDKPTAADRIEALRRRLAAKANARGPDGHDHSAAAMPETGTSASVGNSPGRNELRQQIHLLHDGAGIREPACLDRGGPGTRDTAACAAASRVAWHSTAASTRPSDGGG
jgi:hypothetical protein